MSEAIETLFTVVGSNSAFAEASKPHMVVRKVNDHIVDGCPAKRQRLDDRRECL